MQGSIALEATSCVVCGSREYELEAVGQDYMYQSCPNIFNAVRCLDCGHIYLNPRPTRETVSVIYPETYASFRGTLAKRSIMSWIKTIVVTRRFRKAMGPQQKARVLEVGCGEGQLLLAIREAFPETELTGLDWRFDSDFERLLTSANIRLITGLAEDVTLPSNHYDIVIMNQLIEHLWDVDAVLDACYRSLKVGGILTIETPNTDGYDRKFFRRGAWGLYYFPRHLNLFSQQGLCRILERHGFSVERHFKLLTPLGWVFTMNSLAGRNPTLKWLRNIFTMTNVAPVVLFTGFDLLPRLMNFATSNQKVIAVKRPH